MARTDFKDLLLQNLKKELGVQLRAPEQVAPPEGLPTDWSPLDRFLLWQGLPKSSLSLFIRQSGGATALWQKCAAKVTQKNQWVAWMDGQDSTMNPWSLRHRQVNLKYLLHVKNPKDTKQLLWALQELMSVCLFELIGCDLGENFLKEHQLLKLKRLAAQYKTALVLISSHPKIQKSGSYALILQFEDQHVFVHRALHRPTPHQIERTELYADTLSQLASGRQTLGGRKLFDF